MKLQAMLDAIYPPRCLSCGDMVEGDGGLCGACWGRTPFVLGLACDLCGVPLPGASDVAVHCDDCLTTARPWDRGCAALSYRDNGRRLVLALKHGDRHDIAEPAARWMRRSLGPIDPATLVIPVPLHWTRLFRRRFNQSALLARALARQAGLEHCPDAVIRSRATPSLDHRPRDERFATLSGTMTLAARHRHRIAGRPVLIVDDVMTTGATLAAVADTLRAGGARHITVSVLARVAKDD